MTCDCCATIRRRICVEAWMISWIRAITSGGAPMVFSYPSVLCHFSFSSSIRRKSSSRFLARTFRLSSHSGRFSVSDCQSDSNPLIVSSEVDPFTLCAVSSIRALISLVKRGRSRSIVSVIGSEETLAAISFKVESAFSACATTSEMGIGVGNGSGVAVPCGDGFEGACSVCASGFAPAPPPSTHRRPGKNVRIGLSSSFYNKHLKTPVSESQWETGEARVITVTASAPADRPFANVLSDFVTSSGEGASLPQAYPSLLGVTIGHLCVSARRSDMEILMPLAMTSHPNSAGNTEYLAQPYL